MLLVVEFKSNYVILRKKKLRRRSPWAPEAVISLLGSRNIFTPFPPQRGPPTITGLFFVGLPIGMKNICM